MTEIKTSREKTSETYKIKVCDLIIAPWKYFDN